MKKIISIGQKRLFTGGEIVPAVGMSAEHVQREMCERCMNNGSCDELFAKKGIDINKKFSANREKRRDELNLMRDVCSCCLYSEKNIDEFKNYLFVRDKKLKNLYRAWNFYAARGMHEQTSLISREIESVIAN